MYILVKKVLFFDWTMKQYFFFNVILNRMWNLDYVCVRFKVGKFHNKVIVKCVNNSSYKLHHVQDHFYNKQLKKISLERYNYSSSKFDYPSIVAWLIENQELKIRMCITKCGIVGNFYPNERVYIKDLLSTTFISLETLIT